MIGPVPWHLFREPALLLAVAAIIAGVAWAVYRTTAATIRRERDAWLIAQLPEVAQHEILSARRERDQERARAEAAERELEDARLLLEGARRAEEDLRKALFNVHGATPAHVLRMSGRHS